MTENNTFKALTSGDYIGFKDAVEAQINDKVESELGLKEAVGGKTNADVLAEGLKKNGYTGKVTMTVDTPRLTRFALKSKNGTVNLVFEYQKNDTLLVAEFVKASKRFSKAIGEYHDDVLEAEAELALKSKKDDFAGIVKDCISAVNKDSYDDYNIISPFMSS